MISIGDRKAMYMTAIFLDKNGEGMKVPDVLKKHQGYIEYSESNEQGKREMIEYGWTRLYRDEVKELISKKGDEGIRVLCEEETNDMLERESFTFTKSVFKDKKRKGWDLYPFAELEVSEGELTFLPEEFDASEVGKIIVISAYAMT